MITIKSIINPYITLTITLTIISLIGIFDYITGEEMSFSIFYIIPIAFLALYQDTKLFSVVFCSGFASLVWFYSEYTTREYSTIFFPVWNAFVRLSIFILSGSLMLYLKEKDKRLKTANDSLSVLNEEKNKFIGIAAHDLRSPIAGISALSGLIINHLNKGLSQEVLELQKKIKTLSDDSLVVLKNLLDVSMIESGKVELNMKNGDYIEFIIKHVELNQILAAQKQIMIVLDLATNRIMVDFDHHYLSEVIDNLLSNAIKYSHEGSEITVKVSIVENNTIMTNVIDKGMGIPEDEQRNLFNYFQKTSIRPTRGESSSGLGLAIAKRIVMFHRGEIGVKSAVNEGSDFFFTLPLRQPAYPYTQSEQQ